MLLLFAVVNVVDGCCCCCCRMADNLPVRCCYENCTAPLTRAIQKEHIPKVINRYCFVVVVVVITVVAVVRSQQQGKEW